MISQGENNPGRKEHDSFGEIEVPGGALWGAQTERARRNFAGIGGGPLPRDFITADGFGITEKCRAYLEPLIEGEDYPPYKNGLPVYVQIKGVAVKKKLNTEFKP